MERATDSGIPTQSVGRKSRLGDLHLAIVMEKEAVKENARWRRLEMKAKIDAQTRIVDEWGPASSAWVAEERNRILGQELTECGGREFSDLVHTAKVRELEARGRSRAFSPVQPGTQPKDLVDARWALAWEDGKSPIGGPRTSGP